MIHWQKADGRIPLADSKSCAPEFGMVIALFDHGEKNHESPTQAVRRPNPYIAFDSEWIGFAGSLGMACHDGQRPEPIRNASRKLIDTCQTCFGI
jgi:hypothetical protein